MPRLTDIFMKLLYLGSVLILSTVSASAAPFQNLGFEEANTNSTFLQAVGDVLIGYGPIADLIPGWQVLDGTTPRSLAGYNANLESPIGSAAIITREVALPTFQLDGNYGVSLQTSSGGNPISLLQRGDVPADAQILTYHQDAGGIAQDFVLSINGTELIQGGTLFDPVFDISTFAGQNVELRLTVSGQRGFSPNSAFIDSITFVVPEPAPLSLSFVGGTALLVGTRYRRWHQKH